MTEPTLYSVSLCQADWDTVLNALHMAVGTHLSQASAFDIKSTYAAVLYDEAMEFQAVANHIEIVLPE